MRVTCLVPVQCTHYSGQLILQVPPNPYIKPDSQGSAGSVPQATAARLQSAVGAQSVQEGAHVGPTSEGLELTSWPAHLGSESHGKTVCLRGLAAPPQVLTAANLSNNNWRFQSSLQGIFEYTYTCNICRE